MKQIVVVARGAIGEYCISGALRRRRPTSVLGAAILCWEPEHYAEGVCPPSTRNKRARSSVELSL
jgi:hypothetical protein